MQVRQIAQTMSAQMDTMFDNIVNKQLEGQDITPEQQKQIDARRSAARDLLQLTHESARQGRSVFEISSVMAIAAVRALPGKAR